MNAYLFPLSCLLTPTVKLIKSVAIPSLSSACTAMAPPRAGRWFGARPTLPDYLPAIGCCDGYDNLAYAFGHQHLGLTLAAISGELVSGLCAGTRGGIDLTPFDLRRFE